MQAHSFLDDAVGIVDEKHRRLSIHCTAHVHGRPVFRVSNDVVVLTVVSAVLTLFVAAFVGSAQKHHDVNKGPALRLYADMRHCGKCVVAQCAFSDNSYCFASVANNQGPRVHHGVHLAVAE